MKPLFGLLSVLLILLVGCAPKEETAAESQALRVLVEKTAVPLGSFVLSSSTLVVTDPGYDLQTAGIPGLGAVLGTCKPGSWKAVSIQKRFEKDRWPMAAELVVFHESLQDWTSLPWEEVPKGVGADTGQVGIWDKAHFQENALVPKEKAWKTKVGEVPGPLVPEELWYSWCCELTAGDVGAAVMPHGVVSRSGYGDGGYPLFVSRDGDGHLIALLVRFVDDHGRG